MVRLEVSVEEVARLYELGHSVTEIAMELNISRTAVRTRVQAAGITMRKFQPRRVNIVRPVTASPQKFTAADKERVCRPPESCFSCPFPDCVQIPVLNRGLPRTSGEERYLKIAREEN